MRTIFPSKLCGSVKAPPSKSCSHRALICAALSDKPVRIRGLSKCDDVMLTLRCLESLGAGYENEVVTPIDKSKLPSCPTLYCSESGSTLRFLLPVVAALGCGADFVLGHRLSERPIAPLCDELCRNGVGIDRHDNTISLRSKLRSGDYTISGNVSSQFISGLLFALPLIGGGSVNITQDTVSADYIEITKDFLLRSNIYVNQIGNRISVSGDYSFEDEHAIEGDWSAAAYWLCAAALGGEICVTGLDIESKQGDRAIVELLRNFGAAVSIGDGISVSPSKLKACETDAHGIPDLVPATALLSAAAEGESRIINAAALRLKESDRLNAINVMLTSMGIKTRLSQDAITIVGGKLLGADLDSFSDHRIAMAGIIAAANALSPSTIDDTSCISKSYPDFSADFISLGGKLL